MAVPDFSLAGRSALITGSGRGIGLAIARAFAGAGAAVGIQDIDADVAEREAAAIRAAGRKAAAFGGDITDPSLPARLAAEFEQALGTASILVNNAAIQKQQPWMDFTDEECERIWRANLLTPIALSRLFVPMFRRGGYGRIINLGSIQGLKGFASMLPYSMSKSALENMTRSLAKELAREQITVNNIAPGYFDTYRNRDHFKDAPDKALPPNMVPLGRVGAPDDCAGVALLLASSAGSYITGQTFYVDGGMSIR